MLIVDYSKEIDYSYKERPYSSVSIKLRIYKPALEYMKNNTEFEKMSEYVCFLLEREMKNG